MAQAMTEASLDFNCAAVGFRTERAKICGTIFRLKRGDWVAVGRASTIDALAEGRHDWFLLHDRRQ
jgi:hypothetical protein